MADETEPKPTDSAPPKKHWGRKKGSKNKKTLERERAAALEVERLRLIAEAEAKAGTALAEIRQAESQGRKLLKEIGEEFTMMFAGLAAYYQPHPQWDVATDATGAALRAPNGVPILINRNRNYDEKKFVLYATMAMEGARDFAPYQSPKLSAVLLEQDLVHEITITGGLPDEQDGSLIDAAGNGTTIELTAADFSESRAIGAGHPSGTEAGAHQSADAAQSPSGNIPNPG